MRLTPVLLGSCALAVLACGKSKSGQTPDPDGGVIKQLPAPHGEPVTVSVLAPTPQQEITTLAPTIDLAGIAIGDPVAVHWSGPGGQGTAEGTASWRAAAIPLLAGENRIVLRADPPAGSKAEVVETTVIVRRNSFLGLRSRPKLNPEAGFVGDATDVIATVALDMVGDVDPASLVVSQADTHGGWTMAAKMADDGDFAHSGDEIPGDGVYAGRFSISKSQAGELTLAVQGTSNGGAAAEIAAIGGVPFVSHLTTADTTGAATVVTDMQHAQDEHKAEGLTASTNAALAVAAADPNVAAAGISHEGSSVWVLTKAGLISGTMSAHPDERGVVDIGNRAAWVGSPPAAALGDQNEGAVIGAALTGSACPPFDVAPVVLDDAVTIDKLRGMAKAGIVVITTHGTTFDENAAGPPLLDVHEFMLTGELVTPESLKKYELDLKLHRLALGPVGADGKQRFLMTRKLIDSLGHFPGSLVYMGACRSYYTGELATAFLQAGASAYLGYTDIVKSTFAFQTGKTLFQCLLTGQHPGGGAATLEDCYDPTADDGGSTELRGVTRDGDAIVAVARKPAHLKMLGNKDLTIASAMGLANAGFESVDDASPANIAPRDWTGGGDARAMTALGTYKPTEGARMGLLSTGLGFTQTSGELSQTFCIPAGAKTLTYDWNFISDEFKSYCGDTRYQDNLLVTLAERGAAEPTVVQAVKIDDLCDGIGASGFAIPDVGYTDMDGLSFATGWKNLAGFDVSAYAGTGRPVTLRFALSDRGDSIYDSVVLLDGLKLQ